VYIRLLTVGFFLFLLLSDWAVFEGPLLAVRRGLVVGAAVLSLPFALKHPRTLARSVSAPPLVYFSGFLVVALALAPTALSPRSSLLHMVAFGGLVLFAVALAGAVSLAVVLATIRLALAVKLVGSLVLGLLPRTAATAALVGPFGGSLADRHTFGGLFGNPNPLCDAAALFLLLMFCDLVERRGPWRPTARTVALAAWYALTGVVAAYLMWQSLSRSAWVALAFTGILLLLLACWRVPAAIRSTRRRVLLLAGTVLLSLVAIPALVLWTDLSRGVIHPGGGLLERLRHAVSSGVILDTSERPRFWDFALDHIAERPWTGYGMASTPQLYAPAFGGLPEHAHNLELEAALYTGIPGAALILLFAAGSVRAAILAFLGRSAFALAVTGTLILLFVLAQVEPAILGSPYPTLPIVLVLATYLNRAR
jgi:O-antigen ligase